MDLDQYKSIKGIEEFLKCFPDKPWHYFHDVLEFRRYIRFDYEEWVDRTYVELMLADIERKDGIVLRCIDAYIEGKCAIQTYIGGLNIVCLNDLGYEAKYKIEDFEESSICIYCSDLEISIIDPSEFIYFQ